MPKTLNDAEEMLQTEETMRDLADTLDEVLTKLMGPGTGFALITFKFNQTGTANYISNGTRDDMIQFLRETLERFEQQDTIPAGIGAVN